MKKMDVRRLCSLGTQVREVGKSLESIYDATVAEADNYTHHKRKQNKNNIAKYVFSKTFGMPLAALYGFVLIWIISDIILGHQKSASVAFAPETGFSVARNVCAQYMEEGSNSSIPDIPLSESMEYKRDENRTTRIRTTTAKNKSTEPGTKLHSGDATRGILFQNDSISLWVIVGSVGGNKMSDFS